MKVLDLFCGCGGFSLGFKMLGFDIKYAIDCWKGCKDTFEYNHPNTEFILEDIRNLDPNDFKNIDIIIGSPPCQNFSVAKVNPDPKKGMELVFVYLKWIETIKPKYWIMENVPPIIRFLKKKERGIMIPRISLLNSADYGVPQKRVRCFAGKYFKPKPTHHEFPIKSLLGEELKKWVSVEEAISDIMFPSNEEAKEIPNHEDIEWLPIEAQTSKIFLKKHKPLILNEPSKTVLANAYKMSYKNPNHRIECSTFEILNAISINCKGHQPYNKISAPNHVITTISPLLKSDKTYRRLTVRELARLQSFPDDFIFIGSIANQYKMVGNAVPPLMSKALAKAIKNKIKGVDKKNEDQKN